MKRPTVRIDVSGGETNPHLRAVGEALRKANRKAARSAVTPLAQAEVVSAFLAAITGKAFLKGETVRDLIARNCPEIYDMARERGLEFVVDLPSNTWENLSQARIFYEFRPCVRH